MTTKPRGGASQGAGAPRLVPGQTTESVQVRLDPERKAKAREIGGGSVAKGMREAIDSYQAAGLPEWLDSPPTKTGHYWLSNLEWEKSKPGPFHVLVEMEFGRLVGWVPFLDYASPLNVDGEWDGGKWCGPFDPPELPTT